MRNRIILHVDMDAFYASIEMRDNPNLIGKPLIIGAKPEERGVVATCNYEARKYGVRSGMNIKEAYRLCPNGVYMHPDFKKYREVSNHLHKIWSSYTDVIEYIALDEAFLDLTEKVASFNEARTVANELKNLVFSETHLTCSVGVGYSKSAAKLSSEENKPNGYFEILTPQKFIDLVSDRGVRILPFVGPKTEEKLKGMGILTVSDIRDNSEKVKSMFGKHGEWMVGLANGEDNREVQIRTVTDMKSVSREVTFQTDINDKGFLKNVLFLLSFAVYNRLSTYNMRASGISIKVTYCDMKKVTRQKKLAESTGLFEFYKEGCALLDKIETKPVRLIGFRLYGLSEGEQADVYTKDVLNMFVCLYKRYNYDFLSNRALLMDGEGFHSVAEFMRKYEIWAKNNRVDLEKNQY